MGARARAGVGELREPVNSARTAGRPTGPACKSEFSRWPRAPIPWLPYSPPLPGRGASQDKEVLGKVRSEKRLPMQRGLSWTRRVLISDGSARGSSAGRLPSPARRASACRRAGRAPSLGRRLSARLTPALSIPRLGFQRAGVELRRLVPDPAGAECAGPERRAPSALTL